MSKITNDGLTRSGTGCFIVVPVWQQWGVKWLLRLKILILLCITSGASIPTAMTQLPLFLSPSLPFFVIPLTFPPLEVGPFKSS